MNSPASDKNKNKNKNIAIGLGGALLVVLAATAAFTYWSPPAVIPKDVKNDPLSLGVISGKGEWVVPPLYHEIAYLKKSNRFWVKELNPSNAKYFWPPAFVNSLGKNDHWKLFNSEGRELPSELRAGHEPLREWPPRQALGVSVYPDAMVTNGPDGAELNNSLGRALSPIIFHRLTYVGEDVWVGTPSRDEEATTQEKIFPSIVLGNPMALPAALKLLDQDGRKIATLPKGVMMADGNFVDGMLVFLTAGRGYCIYDKRANSLMSPTLHLPGTFSRRNQPADGPKSFDCFYNLPVSSAAPVKFIDIKKKGTLPSEVVPVTVADDRALVRTQDDMYGLVNRKGEWIIPPEYNRLAYCGPDRLICSKGRLTMQQAKAQKDEIIAPDVR
ncbi:hypothetical protein BH11CYA1_BH11CYA1_07610 [soil metagenome]